MGWAHCDDSCDFNSTSAIHYDHVCKDAQGGTAGRELHPFGASGGLQTLYAVHPPSPCGWSVGCAAVVLLCKALLA